MSIATIFAPRSLRARIAWVIRLTWVATALVPQMTTTSDFAISRGSTPDMRPVPGDIAGPGDADADRAEDSANSAWRGSAARSRRASPGPSCRRRNRARRFRRRCSRSAFEECLGDAVERLVPADRRQTGPSPSARRGAAAGSAGRDDGCARRSARLSRRRRPRCRAGRRRRGRARCASPPITSTSSAQTDGQSCGQTEGRRTMSSGAFIQSPVWRSSAAGARD